MTAALNDGTERPSRWPAFLLVVLILTAMGQVCGHEFAGWDDPENIYANPNFNPPTVQSIAHFWVAPVTGMYIPLPYTLWGLLALIARLDAPDPTGSTLNPWIYHSANLLVHVICSLIVLDILQRLTRRTWASFVGAAIFAVHPVQVETVAWASGMRDLLCVLFMAVAIDLLVRGRQKTPETTASKLLWCWAGLSTLAACLSKATGVVTPAMLLAIDVMILPTSWRRAMKDQSAAIVVAITFAIIGRLVQPPLMADLAPLWARPLVATDALAFYVWKLIWPLHLSMDYGRTPQAAIAAKWIYFTWPAPLIAAALVWWNRRRSPAIAAGALIAIIGVALVLGLISFNFQAYSTPADHYLYPSMLGVAMIVAAVFGQAHAKWKCAVAIVAIAALTFISAITAGYWRNTQALCLHILQVNPHSFVAYNDLGVDRLQRGDGTGAREAFENSIAANPDYAFPHLSMAQILLKSGDGPGALNQFRQVLRIYSTQRNFDPALASGAAGAIAAILIRQGEFNQAAAILQDAITRDPDNQNLALQLASLPRSATTKTSSP